MKVIYIFWTERLNEQRGGIHRIILLLLKHLPLRGYDVKYLYTLDDYETFKLYDKNISKESIVKSVELKEYLISNRCNIILGQDGIYSSKLTHLVKTMNIPGVTFINEYHSSLLLIVKKLSRDYLYYEFILNNGLRERILIIVKFLFYPIWKKKVWKTLVKSLRYNFYNCDITLLLTSREEPIVRSITAPRQYAKCIAIPNPLSWDKIEDQSILEHKRNEVLVVSRIYNPEKRIDLILKIWKELQKRNVINDWTLRIVGDGIHKDFLMQMAIKMNLKNIVWEGWSDPIPFYRTASIFMMTSACEGWGLTLTESMQTGVVPLAFDTYPALKDIITDGYDGYVVKPNNIKKYADKMQALITDKQLRENLAKNALVSCHRFSTEKIMNKWAEMLNNC